MHSTDILDQNRLLERYRGKRELVEELYRTFMEDLPGRLDRFEAAVAASDLPALEHEAHALKGACGTLHASKLGALSADLEAKAREGESEAVLGLWIQVKNGLDEVAEAMREFL